MVKRSIYFLIVACLFLSACGSADNPAERVVILVGDRNITEDELKREIKRITFEMGITDQGLKHVIEPLINKIIDNHLIFEYGKANGVVVLDNELNSAIKEIKKGYPEKIFQDMLLHRYIDFEEWKEGLRQQLLIKKIIKKASENIAPVTFNEIKAYFDSHQDEYRCSQLVKLRQIVTQSRDEAEKILGLLTEGQAMDVLARRYSITPEAENGGEVGWIAKGGLEKSMEKAFFSLPVGKISPVVKGFLKELLLNTSDLLAFFICAKNSW